MNFLFPLPSSLSRRQCKRADWLLSRRQWKRAGWLFLVVLTAASCRSSKDAVSSSTAPLTVEEVVCRAAGNNADSDMSARCSFAINMGDKKLTAGGSLKMVRGEIIQLSLTFMGFEVGRMEFTPADVTIIDRINKRYVRGSYNDVEFAQRNNLSFEVAQAVFWGEIFSLKGKLSSDSFRFTQAGKTPILSTASENLTANFILSSVGMLRQTVLSQAGNSGDAFTITYDERQGAIPTSMTISPRGQELKLTLTLDGVRTNTSGRVTPTAIPENYKRLDTLDIFRMLNR